MDWRAHLSSDGVGYLAAALTTIAFVPQVAKTWRSKSVDDLSLTTLATFSLGLCIWLAYGIALRAWPIVAANGATLGLNVLLIAAKIRHGTRESD